ncbi:glycoside hydrolase family 113 [Clostridium gasigenes]|uniref:glycoside hydrolase family 113 n=1 Tax=Clostridium gasigenes TaxID=94869 RepID=UPI001C0DECFF|nr:hydrolase [Clostridium gasigenes]MBU3109185.1 hydrolase [Clostridium gasigenes]
MSKKNKIGLVTIFFIVVVCFYMYNFNYTTRGIINKNINKFQGKTLNGKFEKKIKSGNLSTDYTVEEALNDIDKFGLNTINLPIVINIDYLSSSDMNIYDNSLERAKMLLDELKGRDINIILEPYPWIENGSKYETELNPEDKEAFFNNWKTKVIKPLIDEIAIPYHIDAFNIATSFSKLEYMEDEFCNIIDYVRGYYKGLVTYRTSFWVTTNWNVESTMEIEKQLKSQYENKLNNKLFSKVDFISIASYFELTDNNINTVDNLVNSINSSQRYYRKQEIKEEVKAFNGKWGKPIFFGELGFPRTEKASIEPWNPHKTTVINSREQGNCFEAYKIAYKDEPWFLGFSLFAIGDQGEDKMYYPGVEATEVIKNWDKE